MILGQQVAQRICCPRNGRPEQTIEVSGGEYVVGDQDRCDKVILLCSEASLNSWWVSEEIKRWSRKERDHAKITNERTSMVIPVDLDGHLHDSTHEYAATILETKVLTAHDWNTDTNAVADLGDAIVRALRRDKRSPFETLAERATEL